VAARSATPEFPWESIRHPVLLYVSMGTLFNTDASFYLRCFETFANRDCQVILSTGNTIPLESLGTPPANFIVRSQVPQLDVLQRAAAFVTHGGMNSVSESLYYGVPMLVIPQMGEQGIVACRVAELGAGIHLSNAGATAENLWNSVSRLLAEESFRHRAENIRESFLQAGGVPRAADAILNLVRHAGSGLPASAPAR
jgi:MGT family glycosyltransferase